MEVFDIKQNDFSKKISLQKGEERAFLWLLHQPEKAFCELSFDLGEGSRLNNFFLFSAYVQSIFHIKLTISHAGKNSLSRTIVRGIGRDQSRAEVLGEIRIQKTASLSEAWFEGRALLFDDAHTRIDPRLEILTSEVKKASHAAAVSKISEEELFYLKSRGIEQGRAEELKARGFLLAPFFCMSSEPAEDITQSIKPLLNKLANA